MMRTLWTDRPLGVKLAALVAAGAIVLAVVALITVQGLQGTGQRAAELLAASHATGEALEADMMHDAVRADVLQAMLNQSGPLHESAVTDLADHSEKFRTVLKGVGQDGLGADVTAAVEAVLPLVEQYLGTAQQVVALAGQDPAQAMA